MAAVLAFMESPLVTWVRTFSPNEPIHFQDLSDGIYLNDVLLQIDQRVMTCEVNREAKDSNARLQNWLLLNSRLRAYYQDILQQLIVMDLPNILSIIKEPTLESSLFQLRNVLLLLLGCAVQCDHKENFITIIKQLDIATQEAIVENIKEVTEVSERIMPLHLPELDEIYRNLHELLRRVVSERDRYAEALVHLTQECDYYQVEAEVKKGPLTPPANLEKYHLHQELNKCKIKLNNMTKDLDEKLKTISDMKDELEESRKSLNKVRRENFDLSRKARLAQAYRDELDVVKENTLKVERYEKDITRYKERLNELDFYKSRVEELREDNSALIENKKKVEDQLATATKRVESIMDDLVQAQIQAEDAVKEKDIAQRKLQEVLDENAALEMERSNMGHGTSMRRIISYSSLAGSQISLAAHPNICDELKDSVTAHLTRLETENEDLRRQLDESRKKVSASERDIEKIKAKLEREYEDKVTMFETHTREIRHQTSIEMTKEFEVKVVNMEKQGAELKRRINEEYRHRMAALEAQCTSLKKQVEILQESWTKDKEHCQLLEKANRNLKEEKERVEETLQQREAERGMESLNSSVSSELNAYNERLNQAESDVGGTPRGETANNRSGGAKYILPSENSLSDASSMTSRTSSLVSLDSSFSSQDVEMRSHHRHHHPSGTSTPKGVVMRQKPARGVVAPQRRSLPVADRQQPHPTHHHHSSAFRRDDQVRATITPMRPKSESLPFSRGSSVRASMPERKTVYVAPERRSSRPSTPTGYHGYPSPEKVRSSRYSSGSLSKEKSASRESFSEKIGRFISRKTSSKTDHNSDRDSGNPTSPGSPDLNDSQDSNHFLTSLSIVSSETIRSQFRSSQTPKMDSKWKMFLDKIVDLQDKNQQLFVDNSELRRAMGSIKYGTERLDKLEARNLKLETENRRLTKIIEMLQGSGRNPHDSRLYHYYSNV